MRGDQFGRILQVLLEAQFEGLTDGADDLLSQTLRALQDVTRWTRECATCRLFSIGSHVLIAKMSQ